MQKMLHIIYAINIFIYDFVPLTNSKEDTAATERAMAFYTGWYVIITSIDFVQL